MDFFLSRMLQCALVLFLIVPHIQCLFVNVDPNAEECFYDKVTNGTKMSLTFEVAEGGFLDIDVKIVGPDGKVIYQGERETNGNYTFAAYADGKYTYCFSNAMTMMTPKIVEFSMDIGEAPKAQDGEAQNAEAGVFLL